MSGFSLMHWAIVGLIAILLLGGGRFSRMMGDVAKGMKSFKKELAEEDADPRAITKISRDNSPA